MPFLAHLEELRKRSFRALGAILVFAIGAFIAKDFIFGQVLLTPKEADFITYRFFCHLSQAIGLGESLCVETIPFELINIDMSGQFTSHIMVSFIAGIIVAFPYVFRQVWGFVKPGLKKEEARTARGVVFFCSLLFMMGVLFGYFVIAPLSVRFLGSYQVDPDVPNQIKLTSYITTVASVTLAAGLLFQLPVVVYFLSKLGLVTPAFLRTYRRHALVTVLVLAAVITPPDITSQILVAFPLLVLYEVSIFISKRVERKRPEI